MSQNMDFRLSEVIRLVTNNVPSSCNATYSLFRRKLLRYNAEMRVQGRVSASGAHLLCGSQSSQQTTSSVAPNIENDDVTARNTVRNRTKPPAANDRNNNVNDAGTSEDDDVIELVSEKNLHLLLIADIDILVLLS